VEGSEPPIAKPLPSLKELFHSADNQTINNFIKETIFSSTVLFVI